MFFYPFKNYKSYENKLILVLRVFSRAEHDGKVGSHKSFTVH